MSGSSVVSFGRNRNSQNFLPPSFLFDEVRRKRAVSYFGSSNLQALTWFEYTWPDITFTSNYYYYLLLIIDVSCLALFDVYYLSLHVSVLKIITVLTRMTRWPSYMFLHKTPLGSAIKLCVQNESPYAQMLRSCEIYFFKYKICALLSFAQLNKRPSVSQQRCVMDRFAGPWRMAERMRLVNREEAPWIVTMATCFASLSKAHIFQYPNVIVRICSFWILLRKRCQ